MINTVNEIAGLFGGKKKVESLREQWLQPRKEDVQEAIQDPTVQTVAGAVAEGIPPTGQATQPSLVQTAVPDPTVSQPSSAPDDIDEIFSIQPGRGQIEEPEFRFPDDEVDDTPDEDDITEDIRIEKELLNVKQRFEEGSLVTRQEQGQARADHLNDVIQWESAGNKGLVKTSSGGKWMPIKSGEGRGPDKSMSEYEIGHGIKIPEAWLKDDKRGWPEINGVKVDIREGITRDQESAFMRQLLEKSYKDAEKKVSNWKDLTENEKVFWGDLTYNGGAGVIDANPKAKAALKRGHTAEAMVLALDYIGSAGTPSRGLLRRRISMYNKAASEMNGVPLIEEYKFGKKIQVKFAHGFMTDKVSPKMSKSTEKNLWRTFSSWTGKYTGRQYSEVIGDDLQFKE